MTVTPSSIDVQSATVQAALSNLHTCMPAEVVRVLEGANKRQFVDVQPCLQRLVYDDDAGEWIYEALPMVPCVPVAYMQGGRFFVSLPLAVGDFVTLVFAERSLDHWLQVARKGGAATSPAGDAGMHTLEGAIALPCGPAPRPELLEGIDATDLVVGGPAGIVVRAKPDGEVVLAEGDSPIALGDKADDELRAIKADVARLRADVNAGFGAVTEPGGSEAIATARASAALLPIPPWTGTVAATKAKAK